MMNRSTLDSIVPTQHKGRKAKVQISANCYSVDAASKLYEFLKISLADVNNWREYKPGMSFSPNTSVTESVSFGLGQYTDDAKAGYL